MNPNLVYFPFESVLGSNKNVNSKNNYSINYSEILDNAIDRLESNLKIDDINIIKNNIISLMNEIQQEI